MERKGCEKIGEVENKELFVCEENKNKIKTIDVNVLEWFDRVNGNSYFAGKVTVNYGMKDSREYIIPFQYGYGEQYLTEAMKILIKKEGLDIEPYAFGSFVPLWRYAEENNIILRSNKQENAKKRDLMRFVE